MNRQYPGYFDNEPDYPRLERAYALLGTDATSGLAELRLLAERGSPMSMVYLGWAYGHSEGVEKDLQQADRWYRMAIATGSVIAQHYLARQYLRSRDFGEAQELLKLAVKQDYPPSLYMLGRMRLLGIGGTRDAAEGAALLERAMLLGNIPAKILLAQYLMVGNLGFGALLKGAWLSISARAQFFYVALTQGTDSERIRL